MEPKISVIVPVYNSEQYLNKCLDSIINQSYNNLEIIIVNDGSTDSSLHICQKYERNDSRIIVINKPNEGVSMARNAGLKIATGEYIGFVDSDDTITITMYEQLYTNMIKHRADISVCSFAFCYKNSPVVKNKKNLQKVLIHDNQEAIENALTGTYYAGQLCNKLFKSHLFFGEQLDMNVKIYEDLQIFIKILIKANKLVFDPQPLYNYYMRSNSACNSMFNSEKLTAHIALKEIYLLLYKNYPHLCKYAIANCIQYDIGLLKKINRANTTDKCYYQKSILNHLKENGTFGSFNILKWPSKIFFILAMINIKLFNWCDNQMRYWRTEKISRLLL